MTKDQLVSAVAKQSGNSKKVTAEVLDGLIETLKNLLIEGDSVTFLNFGKLSTRIRKGGVRRNPRTGETMEVADGKYPHMAFATNFKKLLASQKIS